MADSILVLGPAWVGDMVLAQSLFKHLKSTHPNTQIDVAAPSWTLPLLNRMPEVDHAIPLPFKHGELAIMQRIRYAKSLKNKHYQQAILLTNSLKSAILPFAAGIPVRTGFIGEFRYGLVNDIRKLNKQTLPRTVDRFVALGCPDGTLPSQPVPTPQLIADESNANACLTRLQHAQPQSPVLALCPGAEYGDAKRWPIEYYAEVANAALAAGHEVWIFGSDKDKPVTQAINDLCQQKCWDLGGKTKLGEAIDLMNLCDAVVSNDSGLMHIAAALNKKLVALYGSSDPRHTPPMNSKAIIEYLGLSCSPCFKRTCPLKHLNCLREIKPQSVISALIQR